MCFYVFLLKLIRSLPLCIPAQVNKIPTPQVYLISLIPLQTGHLKCFTHPHIHTQEKKKKGDKIFAPDDVHALIIISLFTSNALEIVKDY